MLAGARCFGWRRRTAGIVPEALVSRRRGRPSNRAEPAALRAEVLGVIKERYSYFGPTLAEKKLAELTYA
jgi:hypothetical protein